MLKSAPAVMELMVTGVVPRFVSCSGFVGLVAPTATFPVKSSEVRDRLTAGPPLDHGHKRNGFVCGQF